MTVGIDRAAVGREFPPIHAVVRRERLLAFARATGQADPIYVDVDAARAVGHPDLPAPPTFLFFMAQEDPMAIAHLERLGVPLNSILHGEQHFRYHHPVHAGDRLTLVTRIVEVWRSRGGRFDFARRHGAISSEQGLPVVDMDDILVARLATEVEGAP